MKKISIKILLFYLLFFCACQNEFLNDEQNNKSSFSAEDARAHFETIAEELAPLSFNSNQILSRSTQVSETTITPEWEQAVKEQNENVELIGIPLSSNTTAVASQETMTEQKFVFNSTMLVSRKLMIAKQKNGTTQMFIVTLIPDDNHLSRFSKDPDSFRYLGGSDFTGLVFCSTLSGQFIEGYRYDNGKQTAPLHVHQCDQKVMDARSEYHGRSIRLQLTESTQAVSTYSFGETGGGEESQTCSYCQNKGLSGGCPRCGRVTSGDIGEVVVTYCSGCHLKKDECRCCPVCHAYPCKCCKICWHYPCTCPIPTDPNLCEICHKNPCECHRCQYCGRLLCYGSCLSSGGSTGSSTDPLKYIEKRTDRFAMSNIPRTMNPQLSNTCVTSIMTYVNHLFGGNINELIYWKDYQNSYNAWVPTAGVDLTNIYNFTNKHFNTIVGLDYQTAISQGMVVMTDIRSKIDNSLHNVLIVGYGYDDGFDGRYIYMDPEKGYLCETRESEMGLYYVVIISDKK